MKNNLTKILAIACAMTLVLISSSFAEENLARFAIDKNTYEKLSKNQKDSLSLKINELTKFIDNNLKTKLPADILDLIKNLKVKISLTDKPGRDGLFAPQESGEHIISIQLVQIYSNGIKALLAHEIYHAIHFHLNPDEAAWVREGMAQLFEFITTGETNGMNLYAAINNPMTPLLGNYSPEEDNRAQYGHNQIYFYYMYTHCGKDNFFWKLTKGLGNEGLKGSFLIDAILDEMNLSPSECKNFTESAISLEVAKLHNQMQFQKTNEKQKYFIFTGEITPKLPKASSEEELKAIILNMPVLSSYRLPLKDYLLYKGDYSNFEIFYASKTYPYSVSVEMPQKTNDIDVILVKLRKK